MRTTSIRELLLAAAMCCALHAQAADSYHWIQYTSSGLELRVIKEQGACPQATVDSKAQAIPVRAAPNANYPVTVCSLALPMNVRSVVVEGRTLPLPKAQPSKILIIGDTGCRMKDTVMQNCNDPKAWPFRAGSRLAAQLKPDLVLHVGDFHYRETPCPQDNAGCAGSPSGDNWAVWKEDFFSPVGDLLGAAPWVMTRGNHEECERGGHGWARTMDPYPWQQDKECLPSADPYFVDLGGVTLAVFDVATADEPVANAAQAEHFRQLYAALAQQKQTVWVSQHRPIWAPESVTPVKGDNKTLELAARDSLANVQAIFSGHHHAFAALSYSEELPAQWVVGNGGDELTMTVPERADGLVVGDVHVKHGRGLVGVFGYSVLERSNTVGTWTLRSFDYSGKLLLICVMEGRNMSCKP